MRTDGTVPQLHLCLKTRKEWGEGGERNNEIKVNELIEGDEILGYQGGIKIKDYCDVTPCGLLIEQTFRRILMHTPLGYSILP